MAMTKEEKQLVEICNGVIAKSGPTKVVDGVAHWKEGSQDRFLQALQARTGLETLGVLRGKKKGNG
jgi:hypothetical protein